MRRDTQHMLLLLLGGALLRISAGDVVLRYVRPDYRWAVVAAGVVIVVLAVAGLLGDRRAATATPDPHLHEHDRVDRAVPWLLLVPVLSLALVAPPALGSGSLTRTALPASAPGTSVVLDPLPDGPAPEIAFVDLLLRATSPTDTSLHDRTVTLTGFTAHRDGDLLLARFAISCCAADARPQTVRLTGDPGVTLDTRVPPDVWLRVEGTVVPGTATAETRWTPTVRVGAVTEIPAPPDPYEY